MKHLILLALGLFALTSVPAQSVPLPGPADYPADVRLPAAGSNRMHWTSTGAATWSLELSSNLVSWAAYTNLETSLPPGETVDLQVGLPVPAPASPQFVRLTHRHAPPSIVTQPLNFGKVGTFYPFLTRVDGDFPLFVSYYQDGQLLAVHPNLHESELDLASSVPDPFGQLPHPFFAVVSNPWGSVTSQVAQAAFGSWPDFAPWTITNRVIELNVQFQSLNSSLVQTGPKPAKEERFAVPARYRIRTAGEGFACEIEGLNGVHGGPGTYEYSTGFLKLERGGLVVILPTDDRHIARLNFRTTSPEGGLLDTLGILTFRSATNGTFRLFNTSYTVSATGEFGFVE